MVSSINYTTRGTTYRALLSHSNETEVCRVNASERTRDRSVDSPQGLKMKRESCWKIYRDDSLVGTVSVACTMAELVAAKLGRQPADHFVDRSWWIVDGVIYECQIWSLDGIPRWEKRPTMTFRSRVKCI